MSYAEEADFFEQFGIPAKFLLCINPFWFQKVHVELLHAMAALHQQGIFIDLVCLDFTNSPQCPEYAAAFQQLLHTLSLQDHVTFLNNLSLKEKEQLIRRSTLIAAAPHYGISALHNQCKLLEKRLLILESAETNTLSEQIRAYWCGSSSCHKDKASVTIATSLAPWNTGLQEQAIQSWLSAGFQVVSLNVADELPLLQKRFPNVEFIVPYRNAKKKYGKPLIYVNDLLDVLKQSDAAVCGIVNSDIHFRDKHLYPFLLRETPGAFVYGARIEVDTLQDPNGCIDPWGFDYFFLDRSLISYFPQADYCLGAPMWDFWLPLTALGYGIPVKKIMTPHAFHLRHEARYDSAALCDMARALSQTIAPPFELTNLTMEQYGTFLRNILAKCSVPVTLNP